jgi:hypothetical protein
MEYSHESKVLRLKQLIFFKINYIAYALWLLAFISFPYLAIRSLPYLSVTLKSLGINIEGTLQSNLIMSFLATGIAALLGRAWIPHFQRWVRQRTLPVNIKNRESHLKRWELYNDAISKKIKNILPDDLKVPWIENPKHNQFLIPVRAEELASTETRRPPAGRIKELLRFLDLEFFFKVRERLQPITIQGEPGSGKSTLIFELYRQHANRLQARKQGWMPIIIFAHELSWEMLSQQDSLKDLLIAYSNKCFEEYQDVGYDNIVQLLKDHYDEYQFIVIVDGLDEITNRPLYENMTRRLNDLLEKEWLKGGGQSNVNRYIVSCRTDDNQRTITSRLISLLTLDYEAVIAHLKMLRFEYHKKSNQKERQIQNVINGLETSKANRLLQNYILNPYLLSLIREYYQEQENPPARTLTEVFTQVLNRELRKPGRDFERAQALEARAQLLKYLSSLLAPYCYRRMIDTLVDGKTEEDDFGRYIKEDKNLASILFGNDAHIGYLQSVYNDVSLARENRIRELENIWGREKTDQFRDYLVSIIQSSNTLEVFIDSAIEFLHKDVLELLIGGNLAEIDQVTGTIKRFRHRRMQDYFMALFVDKIGVSKGSSSIIPLGNAWMREPIRILAAISSKPEQLLTEFHDQYLALKKTNPQSDSSHLSKLTDLMLNASEAIAYLPRPQHRDPDQPLFKLVERLGLEAQQLYFLSTQKLQSGSDKAGRRGWLELLEKCLEILQNIYASEYLRNDKSIFNSYYKANKKTKINSWKALHEEIQWEPDSYQHLAYRRLYPIKRSQHYFPISGSSLFFYVIDAVLCFPAAYDRLIKETHPKSRSRLLPWFGSAAETVFSFALIGLILILAWNPIDSSQSIEFKIFKIGLVIGVGFICAWGAQIFGLMHWSDFHHAPSWMLLKFGKRCFLALKILLPALVRLPIKIFLFFARNFIPFVIKAIRFIWQDFIPFLVEMVGELLVEIGILVRKVIRNPKPLLWACTVLLFIAVLWLYVLPAATYTIRAWEYSSNVDSFTQRVKNVDDVYLTHKDEIEKLASTSISEAELEKQRSLVSAVDQQNKSIVELIGQGTNLANSGMKYSSGERGDVLKLIEKLNIRKEDVGKLKEALVNKGEVIQRETRFQAFKNNFHQADAEISSLPSVRQNGSSTTNIQSQLDQVNQSLSKINDLQKEGEALQSYDQKRAEITSLNKEIAEKKSVLERAASELTEESKRNLQNVPPNPTPDVRTILAERSSQLLNRTTLIDLDPKLAIVGDILKTDESQQNITERHINNKSNWWPPAFYEDYQIRGYLQYLTSVQSIDSDLPLMQRQLADYEAEISAHLNNLKEANQVNAETKQLEDRTLEIKSNRKHLEQYVELRPKLKIEELQKALSIRQQENNKLLSKQWDRLLYVLMFSPIVLMGLIIIRRYGDKAGERKLRKINENFDGLLNFVMKNRYSLAVNVHAVAYLSKTSPISYDSLRKISDAAEVRLRKPGEVNERIGYLLRDVAKGIDNILNRQSIGV